MGSGMEKVALVTGGGTGIGQAISVRLARDNFRVAIIYSKSEKEAFETADRIEKLGGRCEPIRANLAEQDQVERALRDVIKKFGALDWLINNAGATRQLPFEELDRIEDTMWDELFATNVKSVFNLSRAAAPYLSRSKDGSILNTGSIAGETGYGSSLPYAVSKAATHGLTRSLARALAPKVRVNAIAPGAVATRWWAGNEEKMRHLAGRVALGRISTPEEIADSAFMILSSKSMTGQIIRLDNGQTL